MAGFNSSRSNIKNKNAIMVGIDKQDLLQQIKIYPNPAQKFATVEFNAVVKTGKIYFYCYEYGYLPLENDWYLLVRRKQE